VWVSDLLFHEVTNALRYKDDFDEKRLAVAVEDLFGLHLNTKPVDRDLLKTASAIAYRSEVTIYDAIPVALAKLRGTVCITADENTQFKRAKAKGYPVQLLSKETL
jgi:predicted nucleic acid-binding protein